jgi:hypothetical protein
VDRQATGSVMSGSIRSDMKRFGKPRDTLADSAEWQRMLELLGEEDGRKSQCRAETSSGRGYAEHHGPMPMNTHYEATGPSVVGQIALAATVGFGALIVGWIAGAFG